jgi:3'-5' exonuclease
LNNDDVKYLVFDIESIPDGKLIKKVKYSDQDIDEKKAVEKFQEEILTTSGGSTLFIPVTFQYPISICTAKLKADFSLIEISQLDAPHFRPAEMVKIFWNEIENVYKEAALVTFNGRGFDIPLLELMAFRYGYSAKRHLKDKFGTRYRFGTRHFDIHDWLSNYNAIRMNGGLNLLAKTLGKPGKIETKGDEVYDKYLADKVGEINDYCIHDVLDTYFVFLRTRVMLGELGLKREQDITKETLEYLTANKDRVPAYGVYLENCGKWDPWP